MNRSAQGDAIRIQHRVEEVAASMEETLPDGVDIRLIRTRAEAISGRLNILLDNGLLGLGLVVALLFLFLNARTAFWQAPIRLPAPIRVGASGRQTPPMRPTWRCCSGAPAMRASGRTRRSRVTG